MKKSIDLLLKAFFANEPKEDAEYFHDKDLWLNLLTTESEANCDLSTECLISAVGVNIDPWCFADGRARLTYDSETYFPNADDPDAPIGAAKIVENEINALHTQALRSGAKPLKNEGLAFIERWREERCIPENSLNPTHTIRIQQTIAAWISNQLIKVYDPDEGTEVFPRKALKYLANYGSYQLKEHYLVDLDEIKEFLLGKLGALPTSLYPEHESNTRNTKNQAKQETVQKSEHQPVNSEEIKLQNTGQNTDPKGDNQLPLDEHIQKMKDDGFSPKDAAVALYARGVSDRNIAEYLGLDKTEANRKKINSLRCGRQKSIKGMVWPY